MGSQGHKPQRGLGMDAQALHRLLLIMLAGICPNCERIGRTTEAGRPGLYCAGCMFEITPEEIQQIQQAYAHSQMVWDLEELRKWRAENGS